jgi:hypothetical protein
MAYINLKNIATNALIRCYTCLLYIDQCANVVLVMKDRILVNAGFQYQRARVKDERLSPALSLQLRRTCTCQDEMRGKSLRSGACEIFVSLPENKAKT